MEGGRCKERGCTETQRPGEITEILADCGNGGSGNVGNVSSLYTPATGTTTTALRLALYKVGLTLRRKFYHSFWCLVCHRMISQSVHVLLHMSLNCRCWNVRCALWIRNLCDLCLKCTRSHFNWSTLSDNVWWRDNGQAHSVSSRSFALGLFALSGLCRAGWRHLMTPSAQASPSGSQKCEPFVFVTDRFILFGKWLTRIFPISVGTGTSHTISNLTLRQLRQKRQSFWSTQNFFFLSDQSIFLQYEFLLWLQPPIQ